MKKETTSDDLPAQPQCTTQLRVPMKETAKRKHTAKQMKPTNFRYIFFLSHGGGWAQNHFDLAVLECCFRVRGVFCR